MRCMRSPSLDWPMLPKLAQNVSIERAKLSCRRTHGNLCECVKAAGLEWQGRAHSGLDDARNTARLAASLLAGGATLAVTEAFDGGEVRGLRQRKLFPDRCCLPCQHVIGGALLPDSAFLSVLSGSCHPGRVSLLMPGPQGCQETPDHGRCWQVEWAVRVWHPSTAVYS